jgi:hypothetical protein
VTRPNNSHKVNGKANGHGRESTAPTLAASVDAGGTFAALAAEPSSSAAGTNRTAYAEAAAAEARGTRLQNGGAALRLPDASDAVAPLAASDKHTPRKKKEPLAESVERKIPPGEEPLPVDGRDFVEAVHERVDLIALEVSLLRSGDDKIVQRELVYLRELRYGKTAASGDEDPQIIFDLPRPNSSSTPSDEE